MKLSSRIITLSNLGKKIESDLTSSNFEAIFNAAKNENGWFTEDNITLSLKNIASQFLNKDVLKNFTEKYSAVPKTLKNVGIVSSGNIPAVSFHDLICVYLSGHNTKIKLSSSDHVVLKYLIDSMEILSKDDVFPIEIVNRLTGIDAVIATGSNNSSRYFDYYFSKIPNIIRKNRSSIAVLNGNESKIELADLGIDIFSYFGLGCRNISKIFVPKGYDFNLFFESIEYWNTITLHHKYNNNYDYNKSILLINGNKHFDNGFLLLKEDPGLTSPISVLLYEEYESLSQVETYMSTNKDKLQGVVSSEILGHKTVRFGETQSPSIEDFADGIDTMKFLEAI